MLLVPSTFFAPSALGAESRETEPATYRGELTADDVPLDGRFDFRFHLYAGPEPDPAQPVETLEAFGVEVAGGRFDMELDFQERPDEPLLGIEVAEANSGAFRRLHPLQPLSPTLEPRPAASVSVDRIDRPGWDDTTYKVSSLTAGDLRVGGKVVAGGFELAGDLITSWDQVGGGPRKLAHRSSRSREGKFPEMTVRSGGGWITGGSKAITVDGAGSIWIVLTGTAVQPFPSGDYHASVSVGIAARSGRGPWNQFTTVNLGGGQNASASFVTQTVYTVSSAGTYTFYVAGRWNHGWSPSVVRPEGMTLLFVPG